jgi:hypothetical protein
MDKHTHTHMQLQCRFNSLRCFVSHDIYDCIYFGSIGVEHSSTACGNVCKIGFLMEIAGMFITLVVSLTDTIQATEERIDTEKLQTHNRKLLENILPKHMAEYFLTKQRSNDVSYSFESVK